MNTINTIHTMTTMYTKHKTFFTADWHLFHENIIKYCNRPFKNASEMNETILCKLNDTVTENDKLFFLGDMALTTPPMLEKWLSKVRCRNNIFFIKGNHDKTAMTLSNKFCWFKDITEVYIDNQGFTLCHFAMKVWNKSHHGNWHLYGHSHGSLPDDLNSFSMDVGVDTNDFYPYSLDDIKKHMERKTFTPIDHHKST